MPLALHIGATYGDGVCAIRVSRREELARGSRDRQFTVRPKISVSEACQG